MPRLGAAAQNGQPGSKWGPPHRIGGIGPIKPTPPFRFPSTPFKISPNLKHVQLVPPLPHPPIFPPYMFHMKHPPLPVGPLLGPPIGISLYVYILPTGSLTGRANKKAAGGWNDPRQLVL